MTMMKLFNNKIENKIDIKIFSLTKKYTKELSILYSSFRLGGKYQRLQQGQMKY